MSMTWNWQCRRLRRRLRLGLHAGHDVLGITQTVHGMKYVLMREEMKAAHPEFYALWDGKRATDHKGGQGAASFVVRYLIADVRLLRRDKGR